jgi:hypothetical protein
VLFQCAQPFTADAGAPAEPRGRSEAFQALACAICTPQLPSHAHSAQVRARDGVSGSPRAFTAQVRARAGVSGWPRAKARSRLGTLFADTKLLVTELRQQRRAYAGACLGHALHTRVHASRSAPRPSRPARTLCAPAARVCCGPGRGDGRHAGPRGRSGPSHAGVRQLHSQLPSRAHSALALRKNARISDRSYALFQKKTSQRLLCLERAGFRAGWERAAERAARP